ncbi:MAG: phosphate acyltransferase PlsX [Candidatus Omnitrophica bacterium]|nr:phosphate acyltransferase PlsX [Candidatus Omnitrophota bacterium]
MKIIVDAMGGDWAPEVVISGAIKAAQEYKINIELVGIPNQIEPFLLKYKYPKDYISIYPASEVIQMSEPAALSIRKKRESSISVGLNLIKERKADAFFSAGNTGAVVCAATLILGMLPRVERPGIAINVPTLKGSSLIIDVGANINPKPLHLLQYGLMADAYFCHILNKPRPSIGLLNIGEEASKGTGFAKEAHHLLSESHLNFAGNIEGKDLFSGKCDIIISDGFVGNIALKVSESLAETLYAFFHRHLKSNLLGMIGAAFLSVSLSRLKKQIDYSEYGGALLLGVNGVVIIGHGRSDASAVKNAICRAKEEVEYRVNERIIETIRGG